MWVCLSSVRGCVCFCVFVCVSLLLLLLLLRMSVKASVGSKCRQMAFAKSCPGQLGIAYSLPGVFIYRVHAIPPPPPLFQHTRTYTQRGALLRGNAQDLLARRERQIRHLVAERDTALQTMKEREVEHAAQLAALRPSLDESE